MALDLPPHDSKHHMIAPLVDLRGLGVRMYDGSNQFVIILSIYGALLAKTLGGGVDSNGTCNVPKTRINPNSQLELRPKSDGLFELCARGAIFTIAKFEWCVSAPPCVLALSFEDLIEFPEPLPHRGHCQYHMRATRLCWQGFFNDRKAPKSLISELWCLHRVIKSPTTRSCLKSHTTCRS
jgi:hypothetical protein